MSTGARAPLSAGAVVSGALSASNGASAPSAHSIIEEGEEVAQGPEQKPTLQERKGQRVEQGGEQDKAGTSSDGGGNEAGVSNEASVSGGCQGSSGDASEDSGSTGHKSDGQSTPHTSVPLSREEMAAANAAAALSSSEAARPKGVDEAKWLSETASDLTANADIAIAAGAASIENVSYVSLARKRCSQSALGGLKRSSLPLAAACGESSTASAPPFTTPTVAQADAFPPTALQLLEQMSAQLAMLGRKVEGVEASIASSATKGKATPPP